MGSQLLPIDRRWIQLELIPYLRFAFSHGLPLESDISAQIQSAIQFCMHKPDYPTDGNNLIFERICQAIRFRHLNLAPDLHMVTDSLEPLAKYLIRRAQLKGTYELLGRMDVASAAWRENEDVRLKNLKQAAEDEEKANTAAPFLPTKPAPTEDQMDPRLVHSLQGQFVLPDDPGTLTVDDNQYYRHQNQLLVERRRYGAVPPSWQQQLQHADGPNPPAAVQVPGRGWSHGHALSSQQHAPSHMQYSGQRHDSLAVQPHNTNTVAGHNTMMGPPPQRPMFSQAPGTNAFHASGTPPQKLRFAYQEMPSQQQQQQQQQHYPVQPSSNRGVGSQSQFNHPPIATLRRPVAANDYAPAQAYVPGSIPVADIAHLRGNEWAEQAQQRVREFGGLSQHDKAQRLMELHHTQTARAPIQPAPLRPQQHFQQQPQQNMRPTSPQAMQGFANHPGFSNVRSTFPNPQSMAEMAPSHFQSQGPKDDVKMTGLPFDTDPR